MIKIHTFALSAIALALPAQAAVVYMDDFNDGIITGWTFLDRNGATEIANASWSEAGGVLSQTVANYDFIRDTSNDPVLGTIGLSGSGSIGGVYTISLTMDSLENTNNFQDQVVVFGYEDADNFNYVEFVNGTSAGARRAVLHTVIGGERTNRDFENIIFSQAPTDVSLEIDSAAGEVVVTYNGTLLSTLNAGGTLAFDSGENGVGSNNDAFAIDNFVIDQIPEPSSAALLSIAGLSLLRRRR